MDLDLKDVHVLVTGAWCVRSYIRHYFFYVMAFLQARMVVSAWRPRGSSLVPNYSFLPCTAIVIFEHLRRARRTRDRTLPHERRRSHPTPNRNQPRTSPHGASRPVARRTGPSAVLLLFFCRRGGGRRSVGRGGDSGDQPRHGRVDRRPAQRHVHRAVGTHVQQ